MPQPTMTTITPATSSEAKTPYWTVATIKELFECPFFDLLYEAQRIHRLHFDPNHIQRSILLSIKTGGCSEDCGYCSQSARYNSGIEREQILSLEEVLKHAENAKTQGASRFCMGAAWRSPKDKDLLSVLEMVREVKKMGLETCVTLGMLKEGQAELLADAGLDYYNHNIDTSPEFYNQIITTHSQQNRFDTLDKVRDAGIKVCCGGIIGMGESRADRAGLIAQLANMNPPPQSVPINQLVPIPGTPLSEGGTLDPFEFVRTIAISRITMPQSYVRLSAGREQMSDELQALCFMAGANSIFYGDRLLTSNNSDSNHDDILFSRLGLIAE